VPVGGHASPAPRSAPWQRAGNLSNNKHDRCRCRNRSHRTGRDSLASENRFSDYDNDHDNDNDAEGIP
jgi:hypothetical protein